jgi:hypothetical protein
VALIRTASVLVLMTGFLVWLLWGPYAGHLWVQGGILTALFLWHVVRFTLAETMGLLRLVLPFVLLIVFLGMVFQFFSVLGRTDWILDSILKAMLFPSSLLILRLGLSFVGYRDLLDLPLPRTWKRDIIVFRAVFERGGRSLSRMKQFLEWSPYFCFMPWWKKVIVGYGILVLALFLFVLDETEQTAAVWENRMRHLALQYGGSQSCIKKG